MDGASYVLSIPLLVQLTKRKSLVSDILKIEKTEKTPVTGRSFTSIQMVHTHTPPQWGAKLRPGHEMKMRMTGKWK